MRAEHMSNRFSWSSTHAYCLITLAKPLIWNARANEQRVVRVVRTNGRRSVSRAGVLGPGALSLGAD
jgi:hypothetical protein